MEDLIFAAQKILPLLLMMAVGYGARCLHIMNDAGVKQANNAVFRIFLPLLLCLNIMDTKPAEVIATDVILYAVIATIVAFLLLILIVPRVCKQRNCIGVLIQGIARSNYAIFGIPLVGQLYGDITLASLMVVAIVPVFNVFSVIVLMIYGNEKASFKSVVKGIVCNPLIIGTALGFVLWRLNVTLPELISSPLHQLSGIATPLALFLLGASLDFGKAGANLRLLTMGVVGRLIAMPVVCLTVAALLGMRDLSLAVLIAVFASPTAVSSYPMAQQMGGDESLAGAQVVFTTTFSIVTVFLIILVLKSTGLMGSF